MEQRLSSMGIMQELSQNQVLYDYVIYCCKRICPTLDDIESVFREYTDHSTNHSVKVAGLGDKLLGSNILSQWEIAIFILACFYHDVGMYCTKEEFNQVASKDFIKIQSLLRQTIVSSNQLRVSDDAIIDKFLRLEFLRRNHGRRSYDWIKYNYPTTDEKSFVATNIYLWEAVALVCKGHVLDIKDLDPQYYDTRYALGSGIIVDLLFITCLLRLSDICHLSQDRALPYVRTSVDFYSKKSQDIWSSYGEVNDTIPLKDHGIIKIHACCTDFRWHRAIVENAKEIETELGRLHKILYDRRSKFSFPWKFVDMSSIVAMPDAGYYYTDDKFRLDFERITELLIGSNLYRNKLYALRECIQNSLDALVVYKHKDKQCKGYIVVQYSELDGENYLDIFDNGTGMDQGICSRHLLSVGASSFWFSERSCSEWGPISDELSIIANHGIGFISTFLIADKIQVFSKYPENEPVHVMIDSFKAGVIYKTTSMHNFPQFQVDISYSLPWEQRHGSCIRLHLKEKISKRELMEFIAEYIPRPITNITLIYNDEFVELPSKWHFGIKSVDTNDLTKLKDNLFLPPPRDFYFNQPEDRSLTENFFAYAGICGRIDLIGSDTRVTQNGILVSEADNYLLKSELLQFLPSKNNRYKRVPFSFDVELSGKMRFELDAERERAVDNKRNQEIREQITRILIVEYCRILSLIETTTYFPCGKKYYHGANSFLNKDTEASVEFHRQLKSFLSIEKIRQIEKHEPGILASLKQAKLYILLKKDSSVPVSVQDISDIDNAVIFIPKEQHKDKSRKDSLGLNITRRQSEELLKVCSKKKVIVLPGFPNCFDLPLSIFYEFKIVFENQFYRLFEPIQKTSVTLTVDTTATTLFNQGEASVTDEFDDDWWPT